MIELEDDGILLTAIDAWVRVEELDQIGGAFELQLLL
jgi:hypothetical protein